MATTTIKTEVLNPLTLFNTVGQEVENILSARGKDKNVFLGNMGWTEKDLSAIKKISAKDISLIVSFLNDENVGSYLRKFQEDYKEKEFRAKKPYQENKKLFTKLKSIIPLLKEYDSGMDILEDISDFFNVKDESEILQKAKNTVARYRISGVSVNEINLYAWMRRGELDFDKLKLPVYDNVVFAEWIESKEWKEYLEDKKYFLSLPSKFKEFGVGLVFTEFLPKTVYGAVRWINKNPLIQISDREKSLAVCWFTLFHEIGHIILHEHDDVVVVEGEINEKKKKTDKKEKEANAYANRWLYNGDNLRRYIFTEKNKWVDDSFIDLTSKSFGVNQMFVAYWMKKAKIKDRRIDSYIPNIDFSQQ
jgi:Zn-dependent peptidase ImmA (M78 family)